MPYSGQREVHNRVKIIKRNGETICFDVSKIVAAIEKAMGSIEVIDQQMEELLDRLLSDEEYKAAYQDLAERKRVLQNYCRHMRHRISQHFRQLWMKRNSGAGRSNTSAVSDMMLLTIPTPPTAEAAIRSLMQRGMADGAAA